MATSLLRSLLSPVGRRKPLSPNGRHFAIEELVTLMVQFVTISLLRE
jgi:hypothetical protein